MTKKSLARQQRDEQRKNGSDSPGNWDNAIAINISTAHLLMSTKTVLDFAKNEPTLHKYSPDPTTYINCFKGLTDLYINLSATIIQLKEQIGDRRGIIASTDTEAGLHYFNIMVAHNELLTQIDGVYRPQLAILQEEINKARNIRNSMAQIN